MCWRCWQRASGLHLELSWVLLQIGYEIKIEIEHTCAPTYFLLCMFSKVYVVPITRAIFNFFPITSLGYPWHYVGD